MEKRVQGTKMADRGRTEPVRKNPQDPGGQRCERKKTPIMIKTETTAARRDYHASSCFCFFLFCSTFRSNARLMCGSTPPNAMVARISVSSSSSPRMASCRCRGVIRFTFRSLAAFCVVAFVLLVQGHVRTVSWGKKTSEAQRKRDKDKQDACDLQPAT